MFSHLAQTLLCLLLHQKALFDNGYLVQTPTTILLSTATMEKLQEFDLFKMTASLFRQATKAQYVPGMWITAV